MNAFKAAVLLLITLSLAKGIYFKKSSKYFKIVILNKKSDVFIISLKVIRLRRGTFEKDGFQFINSY